ncbi:MAG: winged helix DNA-binding domain-containing protein [Actinomycetales bacterium]|uniref:Winged helix DNA-binding domain-containing protein n=1 Tax=Candidatus Phosphoribacter hodrii TaxID=2953743 RepID=A0A9D7TA74_9MICO|nr:winged helix DNA-binding domain-containing protein [Candidatus Phosphoribacter hodrii]
MRQGTIRRTGAGPAPPFEPTFVLAAEGEADGAAGGCGSGSVRRPERAEALAILADRYVASHGPVTERDFAGWCDQPLRLVRNSPASRSARSSLGATACSGGPWWRTARSSGPGDVPCPGGTITVEVTPFTRPSRALRSGADEAAAAYGRFWELPCTLRWVDG